MLFFKQLTEGQFLLLGGSLFNNLTHEGKKELGNNLVQLLQHFAVDVENILRGQCYTHINKCHALIESVHHT